MNIPKKKIDEILEKTNLVDIISEYTKLEKKGKNYFGLCPFHEENTPSFSVSLEKGIYKCFSCGESGNVIRFVENIENLSQPKALQWIASKIGIKFNFDIKTKYEKFVNSNSKYYDLNLVTSNFYKFFLMNTKSGVTAQKYLKTRNIDQELIKVFDIGLAPGTYDSLLKVINEKELSKKNALELGLLRFNKKYYDFFSNRVIFPIKDELGNPIGFAGRVYNGESEIKYLNSPETNLFKKSKVLYNLHNAIKFIKKKDRVLLYEGYLDVISSYRANIKEVVSTMGTSISLDHVNQLKKYTNNFIFCYDGDAAGQKSIYNNLNLLEKNNVNVKVLIIPNKLDPDDYINKFGAESYNELLKNDVIDVIEFKYKYLKEQVKFTNILERESFKNNIFSMLVKYNSNVIIELYIKKLATDLGVNYDSVYKDFEKYSNYKIKSNYSKDIKIDKLFVDDKFKVADKVLVNYMFLNSEVAKYIDDKLSSDFIDEMNLEIRKKIMAEYRNSDKKNLSKNDLKQNFKDKLYIYFENNFKTNYFKENKKEIDDCIKVVKDYKINQVKKNLEKELEDKNTSVERKEIIVIELIKLERKKLSM